MHDFGWTNPAKTRNPQRTNVFKLCNLYLGEIDRISSSECLDIRTECEKIEKELGLVLKRGYEEEE